MRVMSEVPTHPRKDHPMRSYDDYLGTKRDQFGDKFDPSALAQEFVPYFESGERIRVVDGEHVRTGTIGVTTGWRPAFLLMHRSSDDGSSDVLGLKDRVTHVKRGRTYVAVTCADCGCVT